MTMFRSRSIAALCTVISFLSISGSALAQSNLSDADRSAARDLAESGAADFKSGDYKSAVDKLERAYAVAKVPKLGLWCARALAKVGRLVEASERYAEVTRLDATGPKAAEQIAARAEADSERQQLLPRIPAATITVEGAPAASVEVTVDGVPIPNVLLGEPRRMNPGVHEIRAKYGDLAASQTVSLAEGQKTTVVLRLAPSSGASPKAPAPNSALAPAASPPAQTGTAGLAVPMQGQPKPRSIQRTVGWISLGIGGTGLVVGTVTGIMVLSKKSTLDNSGNCAGATCSSAEHDALSGYNSLRTISTVGFVVGTVGAAAGVTLLLTAPKHNQAGVAAWVGPASAGVEGKF